MSDIKRIDKIKPETLLQLMRVYLDNSSDFKFISGVQPFLMSFAGQRYYVYVKNVSSAYFEDRDRTTRAQLPEKKGFKEIRDSNYPFIFLGYDSNNDVFICWNFHVAKQRLNAANSVSFYSRSYFQEEVKVGEFLRKQLKNGDRPVFFKRRDLVEFFRQIDTFFPNGADFDTINGGKHDQETKQTPLVLNVNSENDYKSQFENYLQNKGMSDKLISSHTNALLGRISSGISHYLMHSLDNIFLVDNLEVLRHWKEQLFIFPEFKELDTFGKNIYSSVFSKYIQFQEDIQNKSDRIEFENIPISDHSHEFIEYLRNQNKNEDVIENYKNAIQNFISNYIRNNIEKDLVSLFNISNIDDVLIWADKLNTFLDFHKQNALVNREYSLALNKYIEFLDERTNNFQHVKQLETQSPVISNNESASIEDVSEVCSIEPIDYETPFIENGKLTHILRPELIEKVRPHIESNRNLSAAQEVWKYYAGQFPEMKLVDWMNLVKTINLNYEQSDKNNLSMVAAPVSTYEETSTEVHKKKSNILRVSYPNGLVIEERVVFKTLMKVIELAGVEKVKSLNIMINNTNLVSDTIIPIYVSGQKAIGNGLYVMTVCDTESKKRIIEQISRKLNLGIIVEQIPIESLDTNSPASPKPYQISKNTQYKIRVLFPDGREIAHNNSTKTLCEVIEIVGPEKVAYIGIKNRYELVSKQKHTNYYGIQHEIKDGWLVYTHSSNDEKIAQIEKISFSFNLGLIVEKVPLY